MVDSATHPIARAILARRSYRIYLDTPLGAEAIADLRRAAALAPSLNGGGAARLELVAEPEAVAALTRVATRGLLGKGNLWLRSAPPGAYAVLVGDAERGVRHQDRHLYNVDVAVLGELVVLAATDAGLGSCWMAAINTEGIAAHLHLAAQERVPAVIAIGTPGLKRKGALIAAGWDRVLRAAVSGRRKPMAKIAALGRFGSEQAPAAADLSTIASDGRGLLEVVASAAPAERFSGTPPTAAELALVLEAMRLAPSAENAQTWRFVVLEGRAATAAALAAGGLAPPAGAAPGALLVVATAPFPIEKLRHEQPFPLIDHPIALAHGILVAEALGLAWNAMFVFDHEAVRVQVGAPGDHPVTAMLALDGAGERAGAEPAAWVQLRR